jgi:hypothetical protein
MPSRCDPRVLAIAEQQRGLITFRQLRELGYSDGQIDYRCFTGDLVAAHPGVVAVGVPRDDWEAQLTGAVLWSRGIASHQAAAWLYDMPGCDAFPLEVTTHDHRILSRCGIAVHHTNRMPRDHVRIRSGLPCTSPERTLLDLGAVISRARVAMALDHALLDGLVTLGSLDFCLYLTARRGRRGTRTLRELVHRRLDLLDVPNSPLESLIFEFITDSGLPIPVPQFTILDAEGRFIARPDFVYPSERIVIEGHSRLWHSDPDQRRRDVARHERMVATDHRVVYLTWYDIRENRQACANRIEALFNGEEGDALPPAFSGDVRKEW